MTDKLVRSLKMSKFLFKDKNELYNQYYPLATNTEKEEFLINNGSSLLRILEKRKKDREYELYALQKLQKQNYRNKDYYMFKKREIIEKTNIRFDNVGR